MMSPWLLLSSIEIFGAGLLRVAKDRSRSPRTGAERDYIEVELLPVSKSAACIADGTIDNALTVAAIGMAFLGSYLQEDGS
jgi:hypothetical protein